MKILFIQFKKIEKRVFFWIMFFKIQIKNLQKKEVYFSFQDSQVNFLVKLNNAKNIEVTKTGVSIDISVTYLL